MLGVDPDVTVGDKAIDVVIPYNEKHKPVIDQLLAAATPLATPPVLTPGDVVGIELEVTDPRKTGENNATKNYDAGLRLTIIAVLKDVLGTITFLRDHLPTPVQDRTMVIDALDLIEIIREVKQG